MKYIFRILLLSLLAGLVSCSSMEVKPSVDKNYNLTLMNQTSRVYEQKMAEGEASIHVEEPVLRTSNHPRVVHWRKKLDALKGKTLLQQLEGVNESVNNEVRYLTDYEHWKRSDKWGFPLETLEEGGDCEDIAMLKIVSLHYLGWSDEGLAVLVGDSTLTKPSLHALLLATLPDGSQLILDSVEYSVVPPSEDHHFRPIYALTEKHMYLVSLK